MSVSEDDRRQADEHDIRQATQLARQMVGRFGMSDEIGFVAVLPRYVKRCANPATARSAGFGVSAVGVRAG